LRYQGVSPSAAGGGEGEADADADASPSFFFVLPIARPFSRSFRSFLSGRLR
jgi:hypothetical protein